MEIFKKIHSFVALPPRDRGWHSVGAGVEEYVETIEMFGNIAKRRGPIPTGLIFVVVDSQISRASPDVAADDRATLPSLPAAVN